MSALWVALRFPLLPLEAEAGPSTAPRALVRRHRIELANGAALAAGVSPGLRLATARALVAAGETDADGWLPVLAAYGPEVARAEVLRQMETVNPEQAAAAADGVVRGGRPVRRAGCGGRGSASPHAAAGDGAHRRIALQDL